MTKSSEIPPPAPKVLQAPQSPQDFVKKGLAKFDLHDPYYFAISLDWKRFALLFLAAQLALNTTFALLYMAQPGAVANEPRPGFFSAFFFSLETLATVGYGEMYPGTTYGHIVSSLEILVGTVFTAIMTGLLFIRFSKPKAKILYAETLVVARHNGKQTLMLRIANGRKSILHNAELSLHMLVRTVTAEGTSHAYVTELPLVRTSVPILAILFTMMHEIDEASPLRGYHALHDEIEELRVFVTVKAHDPAIGQPVADFHTYLGSDIRFGMRYVDAVYRDKDGKVVADYSRLSEIVADLTQESGREPGSKTIGLA